MLTLGYKTNPHLEMPTLYSAQVPAGYSTSQTGGPAYDVYKKSWEEGNAAAKNRRDGDSVMPYIISASLADGFPVVGWIGTVIHVLFWFWSIIMDAIVLWNTGKDSADAALHQYGWFSLVFTVLGFGTLLSICFTHWCTNGIADGGIPPFWLTILKGSVFFTLALAFFMLGPNTPVSMNGDAHAWRWIVALNLIGKVYLNTALEANVHYAGPFGMAKRA